MSATLDDPPVSRGDSALPARGESGASSSPERSNARRGSDAAAQVLDAYRRAYPRLPFLARRSTASSITFAYGSPFRVSLSNSRFVHAR